MTKLTQAVEADAVTRAAIQGAQASVANMDQVGAKAVFRVDDAGNERLPSDWDIEMPMHDIIMAKFVDENNEGEVFRNGLWIKQEMVQKLWRVAEIIQTGPACRDYLKPGVLVMFPSDKGLPMVSFSGEKLIFLNEDRIFAIVSDPRKKDKGKKPKNNK